MSIPHPWPCALVFTIFIEYVTEFPHRTLVGRWDAGTLLYNIKRSSIPGHRTFQTTIGITYNFCMQCQKGSKFNDRDTTACSPTQRNRHDRVGPRLLLELEVLKTSTFGGCGLAENGENTRCQPSCLLLCSTVRIVQRAVMIFSTTTRKYHEKPFGCKRSVATERELAAQEDLGRMKCAYCHPTSRYRMASIGSCGK